jgi:hypothetical protein
LDEKRYLPALPSALASLLQVSDLCLQPPDAITQGIDLVLQGGVSG